MTPIAVKDLLEAGVHFGHQTKRWNPKMKTYIFGERNGIYIIDLGKTARLLKDAEQFVAQMATIAAAAKQSGTALVVGGRGFTEEFRRRCDYTVYCERLKDLRSFADSLNAASSAAQK